MDLNTQSVHVSKHQLPRQHIRLSCFCILGTIHVRVSRFQGELGDISMATRRCIARELKDCTCSAPRPGSIPQGRGALPAWVLSPPCPPCFTSGKQPGAGLLNGHRRPHPWTPELQRGFAALPMVALYPSRHFSVPLWSSIIEPVAELSVPSHSASLPFLLQGRGSRSFPLKQDLLRCLVTLSTLCTMAKPLFRC